MGGIRLTNFGGIIPRRSSRLIPDNAAQRASNCRLTSGELRPFNAPENVYESSKASLLSIFRIVEGAASAWLTWPVDVDVVKAALFGTPYRWLFTGDGEPRITTVAMATVSTDSLCPDTYFVLGVPKPITAPTVTPAGGAGAPVTRYYGYTFYSAWNEEGAVSPLSAMTTGKVDDTWAISGMDAAPPNNGTVTGAYASSKTEFTDTVNHWLRVGEEVVINSVTMAVTDVTSVKKFKVAGDHHTEVAWARKAPWNTLTKNLYRTTGTLGTFELVAEGISGTTYNDTLTDIQIPGDQLISTTWEMPPVGLKGIITLPSGSVVGFLDNKIYPSVPNQPHAFPPEFQLVTVHNIVAIGAFEGGMGIATESEPYIVLGTEPGQMQATKWDEPFPCLSKRSMASLGAEAVYASTHGMVSLSVSGARLWSLPYFTEKEWPDYSPATMVSALSGRRLYVRYTKDGSSRILIFNLLGDDSYLTDAFLNAAEIYSDPLNGSLYLSNGNIVYLFDSPNAYPMTQDWQSKEIVMPMPGNMGAAKVVFEQAIDPAVVAAINANIVAITVANGVLMATGNTHGAINGAGYNAKRYNGGDMAVVPTVPPANEATFMLYVAGVVKASRTLYNNLPFRLPSGYKADTVSVRVISQCKIHSIELASTMQGLGQA